MLNARADRFRLVTLVVDACSCQYIKRANFVLKSHPDDADLLV